MNQLRELVYNVAVAALGNSSKDVAFRGVVASTGLITTDWLGGWDQPLKFLLIAMLIDYVTGLLGAIKSKTLDSDVMFWGGIRKAIVLLVICLADMLDDWIQPGAPIFRTTAVYFYCGREGLSVIENLAKLNVPFPEKLQAFLKQLNDKELSKTTATEQKLKKGGK